VGLINQKLIGQKNDMYSDYFHKLIRNNENALNHLSNIRLKFMEHYNSPWKVKSGGIVKWYDLCVASINEMLTNYNGLLNSLDLRFDEDKRIKKAIKESEERGVKSVLNLEAVIEGMIPQDRTNYILEELYETVEKLNIVKSSSINLCEVLTLHDWIRYLHQKSIEALFSAKNSSKIKVYKKKFEIKDIGTLSNISAIDIRETSKQDKSLKKAFSYLPKNYEKIKNLPIRAFFEIYTELKNKTKVSYDQKIKILASEDSILVQILLGCHHAKLESKIGDKDPFISFVYRDTDYEFSKNRLVYMKLILQKLGYNVEVKEKNLNASLYNKSKEQTYGTLKETIRLLTSSYNLDVTGMMQNREYEAVYRFLKGETDIEEVMRLKKIKSKKCKKFISRYKYDFGNIKI